MPPPALASWTCGGREHPVSQRRDRHAEKEAGIEAGGEPEAQGVHRQGDRGYVRDRAQERPRDSAVQHLEGAG